MRFLIIIFFLFLGFISYPQDYIYTKENNIIKGKVLSVTIDMINYIKIELPHGPTFQIAKKDVYKIRFASGYEEIFDRDFSFQPEKNQSENSKTDSTHFAILYVLFNDGNDLSQKFPLYFNGKYIVKLRNHQRMEYKIYTEGLLLIERRDGKKIGPSGELTILHGNKYGIRILEPYPQALDPNKRFAINIIIDHKRVLGFIEDEFIKLNPFKGDEFVLEEGEKN